MRGSDKVRHIEIKYKEINAPNKVISKADISGEVRTEKFDKIRKEIVPRGLEQKIRKNGIAIAGRPDKNRSKRESTFYNDITEAANLSREDVLISQRFDIISSVGLIVGVVILIYTIVFRKSFDLLVLPMSILGLGLIFTWLIAKWKIDKAGEKLSH